MLHNAGGKVRSLSQRSRGESRQRKKVRHLRFESGGRQEIVEGNSIARKVPVRTSFVNPTSFVTFVHFRSFNFLDPGEWGVVYFS